MHIRRWLTLFKPNLSWLILVALVMLPRVLNLDIFVGPDELAIWGWGNRFAQVLWQGDWQHMLIGDGYPAVTVMWGHAIGISLKWLWLWLTGAGQPFIEVIGLDRPQALYAERRLFLAVANGLQLLAAYPLLKLVWNQKIAVIAIIVIALEPLALTYTRMIRADALLSGFMLLSILALLAFIKTGDRRLNWLAGAMAGLAVLSKSHGGMVLLVALAGYTIVAGRRAGAEGWPAARRWLIRAMAEWGLAAAIITFGLWPAWWTQPLATFNLVAGKVLFHAVEANTERANSYFWGAIHPFGPGAGFYFVLAALRLTPWLLVGSLIALARSLWRLIRLPKLAQLDLATLNLFFFIAGYWLLITIPGQKAERHFIPIIPGLAILAAIQIAAGFTWLEQHPVGPKASLNWSRVITIVSGLLVVGYISLYHPYYSTHYNRLVTTPQFLLWALPVGLGEGVDEALRHLAQVPGGSQATVVCGTNFPRCEPFAPGKLLYQEELRSKEWFAADYALWHVDEQQLKVFPAGVLAYLQRRPPIYVASYHGVDYTWLYAIPKPPFLTGGSKLEGVATLLGYEVENDDLATLAPGDNLRLHLYWENEGQGQQQQFWWRIIDPAGYRWAEAEAQILADFNGQAGTKGSIIESEVVLNLPPDIPPGNYYLKAGFANGQSDSGEFVLPNKGSLLRLTQPPRGPTTPAITLNQEIAPHLQLQGYSLSSQAAIPGETIWATLHWQVTGPIQPDYQIGLWLLNATNQTVVGWDSQPVYGSYPTSRWPAHTQLRDPHPLELPRHLLPGQYQLKLILADAANDSPIKGTGVSLGQIEVVKRIPSFTLPAPQFQTDHQFGQLARLVGYDLAGELGPAGIQVNVLLYWQANGPTPQPYQIQLQLVDAQGAVLADQLSAPAGGHAPTTTWQAGEIINDAHTLTFQQSQPTSASLEISFIDNAGQPVLLSDGQPGLVITDVQQKVNWRIP
jgi:hypothetical protein